MEHKKNSRYFNYFLAILTAGILCVFFYHHFTISYYINDDVTMRNIASGAYSGTPDGHVIYIKYVLGWILSSLYKIAQNIDWYGLLMFTTHFVCLAAVLGRMLNWFNMMNRFFVIETTIIVYFILDMNNISSFQFTTAAAICGVTALFLFVTVPEDCGKKRLVLNYAGIAILALVSYCIRDKVLLMLVPFALVVWIYRLIRDKVHWKRYIALCLVILAGMGVIFGVEKYAYRSQEWKEYREFNIARAEILDYYGYPDYDTHREGYEELGISKEEYDLLASGTLNFSSDLTREKYIDLAEFAKETYEAQFSLFDRIKSAVRDTIVYSMYLLETGDQAVTLLLYFMFACYCLYRRKYDILAVLGGIFLSRELIYIYLLYQGRFIERVQEVLVLCDWGLLLALILQTGAYKIIELKHRKLDTIVAVAGLVLLGVPTYYFYQYSSADTGVSNEALVSAYCNEREENRYILDITTFSVGNNVFSLKRDVVYMDYLTMYGWSCNTDMYVQKKENMGIDGIDEALLEENTYLIETAPASESTLIEAMIRYYDSKGLDVDYTVVDVIQGGEESFQVLDFNVQERTQ